MASTSHDTAVRTVADDRKTVLNQRTNGLKRTKHTGLSGHMEFPEKQTFVVHIRLNKRLQVNWF